MSCLEDKFHSCLSEKKMGASHWQKWSRALLLQLKLLLNVPGWREEDPEWLQHSCFTCHTGCIVPHSGEVNAGQDFTYSSAAGTARGSSSLPKTELVQSFIPYPEWVLPGFWVYLFFSGLVRSNRLISSSYLLFSPSCWHSVC